MASFNLFGEILLFFFLAGGIIFAVFGFIGLYYALSGKEKITTDELVMRLVCACAGSYAIYTAIYNWILI